MEGHGRATNKPDQEDDEQDAAAEKLVEAAVGDLHGAARSADRLADAAEKEGAQAFLTDRKVRLRILAEEVADVRSRMSDVAEELQGDA